jgi:hypothetical protein
LTIDRSALGFDRVSFFPDFFLHFLCRFFLLSLFFLSSLFSFFPASIFDFSFFFFSNHLLLIFFLVFLDRASCPLSGLFHFSFLSCCAAPFLLDSAAAFISFLLCFQFFSFVLFFSSPEQRGEMEAVLGLGTVVAMKSWARREWARGGKR